MDLPAKFAMKTLETMETMSKVWLQSGLIAFEDEQKTGALKEPELVSGKKVEETVERYRKLPPNELLYGECSESDEYKAHTMLQMCALSRAPFHCCPEFHEKPLTFTVSYKVDPSLGHFFLMSISKLNPHSHARDHIVSTQVLPNLVNGPIALQLNVHELVAENRVKGANVLHILIETVYDTPEQDPVYFARCCQLWTSETGVNFCSPTDLSVWPRNVDGYLQGDGYKPLFEPVPIEEQGKYAAQKFTVAMPDPYKSGSVEYDYESANNIKYNTAPKYDNEKFKNETEANYKNKLEEMKQIIECKNVFYEPPCGSNLYGIRCLICKHEFPGIPALLSHFALNYPDLVFSLQRKPYTNGKSDLIIKLFYRDNQDGEGVARERLRDECNEFEGRSYYYDFHLQLLRTMNKTDINTKLKTFNMRLIQKLRDNQNRRVICYGCGLLSKDWPTYSCQLSPFNWVINKPAIDFQMRFFWSCFQAFTAKAIVIPMFREWIEYRNRADSVEQIYFFLRTFVHTHSVLFEHSTSMFGQTFRDVMLKNLTKIFHITLDFPEYLANDLVYRSLGKRSKEMYVTSEDFIAALYREHVNCSKIIKRKIHWLTGMPPKTDEGRGKLLEVLGKDQIAWKIMPIVMMFKDELDFFPIPKCLYFGHGEDL